MFCSQCGTKMKDGAAFCQECGAKVSSSHTPPPVSATTPATPVQRTNANTPVPASSLIMGMHKQRLAILVAAVIGTISMFMPWGTSHIWGMGAVTWNAFQFADGAISAFIALLWFAIPTVMALLGDRSTQLTEKGQRYCFWDGIVGVVYGIWFITRINSIGSQAREGVYIMILACAAITAISFLMYSRTEAKAVAQNKISAKLNTGETIIASCGCGVSYADEDIWGHAAITNSQLIFNADSGQNSFSVALSEISRIEEIENTGETIIHKHSGESHSFVFHGDEQFKNTLKSMVPA